MNIYNKLEEIREKPEHIRMRYVWLCVVVSMLFVLAIWVFSFQGGNQAAAIPNDLNTAQIFEEINAGKQSLDGATQNFQDVMKNQNSNQ
jgi:hypothetical protein